MKLKKGFLIHEIDGQQVMVSAGMTQFSGLIRSNQTAAFIVNSLKKETSKEAIVDAMAKKYDAPRKRIETDVEKILNQLRGIGVIDE